MTGPLLTLLNAQSLAAHTASGYWGDETLYAVAARHARLTPNSFAVRDRHRRLTYAELVEAADRLAAVLAGHGIRSGQRVAVWLPSRIETAVALLACSRNGYVCCPSLHRDHTVGEIGDLLQQTRAAALIAEVRYGADGDRHNVFDAASKLDSMRFVLRLEPLGSDNVADPPFADLPLGSGNADVR